MLDAHSSLVMSALSGASGVLLGAFGAHALKKKLVQNGMKENWGTAVQYQMIHALALMGVSVLLSAGNIGGNKHSGFTRKRLSSAGTCFTAGSLLFSGSIYLLCFVAGTPPAKVLGPITPIGGLLLIGGWVELLRAVLDSGNSP